MKTDYNMYWGSHLPVLNKILNISSYDVLELGMGLYSTPFLHWVCFPDRKLVSYENDKECYHMNFQYNKGLHEVYCVNDWEDAEIMRKWDVVFIDHSPSQRRIVEIKKLANLANYIIVHDTQRNKKFCDFESVFSDFKYRYDYTLATPRTTVLSNFKDLTLLTI